MRSPRAIAVDMVRAMDAAAKQVWEAEQKTESDSKLKALIFAHVCNAYARRGGYGKEKVTD
tara:strand:+ start:388 stop:570 length:183 start_codon:yes stop_codon:yes gene_type:complete